MTNLSPILLLWLVVIVVMDLRIRKVRNWMVLLGLIAGLAVLFSSKQPFQVSVWNGLVGMCLAFVALMPFYALRWMGAGDVKFAAVIGLWFGFSHHLLVIWLGGSLLAGLHGLLVLAWHSVWRSPYTDWMLAWLPSRLATALASAASAQPLAGPPITSGEHRIPLCIPYAGYMAIVAIWVVIHTEPPLAT
ncbi:prepilin peptidase [Comamonas testosteroni]|uniref:Peptidase A24A prepilin type IV n=1 Tax=Comamonas testosteroni (strain DSM 14576 / KF-1) TaxID=399795 RepID=B7WRE7_COMTK|nr:prepilin peptidase [Comamonas testosteroni]EED67132.1 peptidase A24A prepilin type IV [Comamonas testosteroni KF-1]WQG65325.1 prepilin peptidase [Comamonas testosteroni]